MSVIGEQIKKLRKHFNLTQREFGERIGVKSNTIGTYEIGRNEPIDAVISLICREFNVNEIWLRTGKGEMLQQTESNAIEQLCADMNAGETETELLREVLQYYFKIDPKIRELFAKKALNIAQSKIEPTPQPEPSASKNDSLSEIDELKRQNRELQEQIKRQSEDFAELRKELETMKQDDVYMDELSALLFSTPESLDTEKAKELGKQKNARQ